MLRRDSDLIFEEGFRGREENCREINRGWPRSGWETGAEELASLIFKGMEGDINVKLRWVNNLLSQGVYELSTVCAIGPALIISEPVGRVGSPLFPLITFRMIFKVKNPGWFRLFVCLLLCSRWVDVGWGEPGRLKQWLWQPLANQRSEALHAWSHPSYTPQDSITFTYYDSRKSIHFRWSECLKIVSVTRIICTIRIFWELNTYTLERSTMKQYRIWIKIANLIFVLGIYDLENSSIHNWYYVCVYI